VTARLVWRMALVFVLVVCDARVAYARLPRVALSFTRRDLRQVAYTIPAVSSHAPSNRDRVKHRDAKLPMNN